jgi:DNA-directed RNA polymerase specialized sigma24 family protein
MVRVARSKLQGAPAGMADEEDVALSAFKSFCRGTRDGRFTKLQDHEDPWPLLQALTTHKAIDLRRYERRAKRGGPDKKHASPADREETPDADTGMSQLIGKEPDPQAAFQAAEECQELLDRFSDAILRAIALWKMEGFTTEEIASKLDCTTRTVERKLQLIRTLWGSGAPLR